MSDYIPEEHVVMILKTLPKKSLMRCRCVCKFWKQLIDSFKSSIIVNCGELEFLSIDPRTSSPIIETLSRPIEDETIEFRLVGTLHGLVCLYTNLHYFLLWNPFIDRVSSHLHLPETVADSKNPRPSEICSAFWFDPSTKDVKILHDLSDLFCTNYSRASHWVLYSSTEQSWSRLSAVEMLPYDYFHEGPPLMIDGVAYWRARPEDREIYLPLRVSIVCFDFVQERFDVIGSAPYLYGQKPDWEAPVLCNWKEDLALVYWQVGEPYRCNIFLRKGEEGKWINMFGFNHSLGVFRVLWVSGKSEERFRVVAKRGEDLVLYDTRDGCVVLKSGFVSCTSAVADELVERDFFP